MTPWNTQENVSRMEAVLRLETLYVSAISWAMGFAITMATVLLAVAMSMAPTSSPMPSWPPFRLRNRRLMPFNRATKPPFSRMSAQMALTSTATIVVSNMPAAPVPMLPSRSVAATAPSATTMIEPDRMPSKSTMNTLMPTMPPTRTMRYGMSSSRL